MCKQADTCSFPLYKPETTPLTNIFPHQDQVSDLQSQIDSLRRALHELANVSSDISLYVSPSDEKDRCFLEDQLTTPPATPRHDRIVHGSEIPLPITSLFISERDSPITRSGSWHGPMQTKGILEKERGIEIGRSQVFFLHFSRLLVVFDRLGM